MAVVLVLVVGAGVAFWASFMVRMYVLIRRTAQPGFRWADLGPELADRSVCGSVWSGLVSGRFAGKLDWNWRWMVLAFDAGTMAIVKVSPFGGRDVRVLRRETGSEMVLTRPSRGRYYISDDAGQVAFRLVDGGLDKFLERAADLDWPVG